MFPLGRRRGDQSASASGRCDKELLLLLLRVLGSSPPPTTFYLVLKELPAFDCGQVDSALGVVWLGQPRREHRALTPRWGGGLQARVIPPGRPDREDVVVQRQKARIILSRSSRCTIIS